MTLKEIADKISEFLQTHDYDDDFDEFDELCNQIMTDKQTYFQWVTDDCFDTAEALETIVDGIRRAETEGKMVKDYYAYYPSDDDRLFLFVEYK